MKSNPRKRGNEAPEGGNASPEEEKGFPEEGEGAPGGGMAFRGEAQRAGKPKEGHRQTIGKLHKQIHLVGG